MILAALSLLLASTAFAQTVSVNFQGRISGPPTTSTPPMAPADVAGVVPAGNWNNVADTDFATANYEGSPTGPLVDSAGAATAVILTFSANGGWNNEVTPATLTTGNAKMMHGIIKQALADPEGAATTGNFTFNNVPEGQYDLYVYLNTDADNIEADITDNDTNTTYYIKEIHRFNNLDSFVQATNTNPNGPRDTGSFVKFSNLGTLGSGSIGFTAKHTSGGAGFAGVGIAGIQLVKIGAPSSGRATFDNTKTRQALALSTPPIIDGVIDAGEWDLANGSDWRVVYDANLTDSFRGGNLGDVAAPPNDAGDLGFQVFAGYDSANLYIRVRVTDDVGVDFHGYGVFRLR